MWVPKGWFRSSSQRSIRATAERTEGSVLITRHAEDHDIGWNHLLLSPSREPVTHADTFYMPTVTRVNYGSGPSPGFIITSHCTPVWPTSTLVYTSIALTLGALKRLGHVLLGPYTRKLIEQDVVILANQGRPLRRCGSGSPHTEADVLHPHIESLRSHATHGGQPPPEPEITELGLYVRPGDAGGSDPPGDRSRLGGALRDVGQCHHEVRASPQRGAWPRLLRAVSAADRPVARAHPDD